MAEAVERVQSAAEQRKITIELHEPEPPVHVLGDRRQLVSAIYNLLENAVKFSYENGTVEVTGSQLDGEVHLSVADRGWASRPGTWSGSSSASTGWTTGGAGTTGGTGLGPLHRPPRGQNHQGRVEVASREGEGSTFTLVLPNPPEYLS